jgi:hypothetical protein
MWQDEFRIFLSAVQLALTELRRSLDEIEAVLYSVIEAAREPPL